MPVRSPCDSASTWPPGTVDAGGRAALGNDPREWWSLRSSFDITPRLQWDLAVRHVGARPAPNVPAYAAANTRLAWRFDRGIELALLLENLFDERHAEWGPAANRVEFPRALSVQLRWPVR